MTDWPATLIPVGSLVIGSLLTIGGQALADRRTRKREREARAEGFRIQNFEVHREALLKIQPMVTEFGNKVFAERRRREEDGYYSYFDTHSMDEAGASIRSLVNAVTDITARLEGGEKPSEGRVGEEIAKDIDRLGPLANRMLSRNTELLERLSSDLEARQPFLDSYVEFVINLRMATYRSGSNSVVNAGQDYIEAILHWDLQITTADSRIGWDRLKKREYDLHRAVSNALTKGPYDKYEHPEGIE